MKYAETIVDLVGDTPLVGHSPSGMRSYGTHDPMREATE